MADTVDTAIYKLGYDTGNSTQQLNQTQKAAESLVTTTEKLDKSNRTTSAGFDRLIGRYDAAAKAQQTYDRELSRIAKYEAEGIGTAAQHALIRDKVTKAYEAEMLAARAAAGQLTAHEKATASLSVVTGDLQGRLQGAVGSLGLMGQALSALGPMGIAAAAGVGTLTLGFMAMDSAAHSLAQKAHELHEFSESTGLSTNQIQALRKAALALGISTDSMESSLQKATVQFEELRNNGGKTLELLRRYRPELAEQIQSTDDFTEALGIMGKAFEGLGKSQENALSKSFFGKAGFSEMARLIKGMDLKKLEDDFRASGRGLDEGLIKRLDELENKINATSKKAKEGFSKLFSEDILKAELAFWEMLLKISDTMKKFELSPDFMTLLKFAGALTSIGSGQIGSDLGSRLGDPGGGKANKPGGLADQLGVNDVGQDRRTGGLADQLGINDIGKEAKEAAGKTSQALIGELERTVAALGAAATEAEKYELALAKLKDQLAKVEITEETFNRAVKALDTNATIMKGLADQLAIAQAITGEQRMAATEKAKYNELITAGVSEENATARAAKERSIAEAQINTQAKQQLISLEEQYQLETATNGAEKMRIQSEITLNKLLRDGVDAITAQKIAAQEMENAQRAANKSVEDQTRSLNQQTALAEARLRGDEAEVAAAQAYANAIRQGADSTAAAALSAATLRSYMQKAAEDAERMAEAEERAASSAQQIKYYGDQGQAGSYTTGSHGQVITQAGGGTSSAGFNPDAWIQEWDKQASSPEYWEQFFSVYTLEQLKVMEKQYAPSSVFGIAIHNLIDTMDRNTDATTGNTLALSPFYTQQGDHLLGYRGYSAQQPTYTTAPAATVPASPVMPTSTNLSNWTQPVAANTNTATAPINVYQTFNVSADPDDVRRTQYQATQDLRRILSAA